MKKSLLLWLTIVLMSCQHQLKHEHQKPPEKIPRTEEAAELNTQLGVSYLRQGNRERAKRKLLYALELSPHSASANAAMGYFLEQSGELTEAERYYRKALQYSGNSGAQLNNFGTFLCRLGKYQEAERYFLKAVKDEHYIHSAGAYENAGLCAEAIPDDAKATQHYVMALKQDPERKQSLNGVIRIAKKQGNRLQILSCIEQNHTLVYNDPTLLKTAIEIASQEGKTDLVDFYQQRLLTYNQYGAKNDNNNG
ncbi:MAG: type IV pilus biogenesis/stability protein PilW [Legionellaceae bacterium]|nr:type IV pilus biogenesis/stability protein PilW [Legionellaceae bacterium]